MVKHRCAEPCLCAWKGSNRDVRKCRQATGARVKSDLSLGQYQRRKNRTSYLWSVFKVQAKRRKIAVFLSRIDFQKLIRKPCVYCSGHSNGSKWNGIDRLDSCGPYSKSNTAACCSACNYMKGALGVNQFLRHAFLIVSSALKQHSMGSVFAISTRTEFQGSEQKNEPAPAPVA